MATHHTTVTVHVELAQPNSVNRMAEGHLIVKGGPLHGCTISGFTVWQKRGGGEHVTFPARSYVTRGGSTHTSSFIHGAGCRRFDSKSSRRTGNRCTKPRLTWVSCQHLSRCSRGA